MSAQVLDDRARAHRALEHRVPDAYKDDPFGGITHVEFLTSFNLNDEDTIILKEALIAITSQEESVELVMKQLVKKLRISEIVTSVLDLWVE